VQDTVGYHFSCIRREGKAGVWSQGGCFGLLGCTKTPGLWQPESFAVVSVFHTGLLCALSRHIPLLLGALAACGATVVQGSHSCLEL